MTTKGSGGIVYIYIYTPGQGGSVLAATMSSRPPSPIKKTFARLLSPSKRKAEETPPPLKTRDDNFDTWTESNSSSADKFTGWSVVESNYPLNKENVNHTGILESVMGPTPTQSVSTDLDKQFEELMVPSHHLCLPSNVLRTPAPSPRNYAANSAQSTRP
jgi:hypothetical protein